jgi:transposase
MATVASSAVSGEPAGPAGVVDLVGGVDTHADTHTAAAVHMLTGDVLGVRTFPATAAGYRQLLRWLHGFGRLHRIGVEGTGSYGAGLTRYLTGAAISVIDVDRPDRKTRRDKGKSDPVDAVNAARAVLGGTASTTPKDRDGRVEALRNLRIARASAVKHRADVQRLIKSQIVTAPEPIRAALRGLTTARLIRACAQMSPDVARVDDVSQAVQFSLRCLATRHLELGQEIRRLDKVINPLVAAINPRLLALPGVGPETAGQFLVTAGENAGRMRTEAAFAKLCGVSPLPASSGKVQRHRLNRGGDRQANRALYLVVINRLGHHQPSKDYRNRRLGDGPGQRTNKEIIRCLKRYVAREIYLALQPPQPAKEKTADAA